MGFNDLFHRKSCSKNDRINQLLKGEPSILIKNGTLNLKELSRNHIEMEQLRTMLRQQQCFSVENARHVVLENAGQISLVKESDEDKVMSIMVVDEGMIQDRVLQTHDLERAWLMEQLERKGYHSLEDILYAEWSEEKGFYIVTNDDVLNRTYRIDG